MERRREERRPPGGRETPKPESRAAPIAQVLELQSSVGNAAVAGVLQRQTRGSLAEARRTWDRANTAYESGDYARALRLMERLTRSPATTASAMPDLVWSLAVTRARLGDIDGAMTDAMTYGQYRPVVQPRLLELIQRIQTEQAGALYQQGVSAYELQRYREALRLMERLVEHPATTPEILPEIIWNIAATQARLGDVDAAYTSAMTYGQYRPTELEQLLALIRRIGGERALAEAARLFEQAQRAYEQRHYRRALQLFERLVQHPATTRDAMDEILWSMAVTKARLGDIDGAMTDAMTYGQYQPRDQQELIQMIEDIRAGRRPAR